MKSKYTAILIATVGVIGITLAGLSFADPPGRGWGGGPGWGMGYGGGMGYGHMGPGWGMGYGGHMGPGWGMGRGPGFRGRMGGRHFGRTRGYGARPLISIALRYRDELKLDDSQVEKLENLRTDFERSWIREWAEIQTMRLDIRNALNRDKVDLADVEKKIRAIANKHADLRIQRLKTIESGKGILTEEQRKKLHELVTRSGLGFGPGPRFGRGYGMMGPGYGMGPGTGPGTGPGMQEAPRTQ